MKKPLLPAIKTTICFFLLDAYEYFYITIGETVRPYWMRLAPGETRQIKLDLKADIAGKYKGKASNTFLYYTPEFKHWNEGMEIEIK